MDITIVVFGYNAENTIIEALDSVYDQTYRNIHLIISDDASTDNTVRRSREWMEKHNDRFLSTVLNVNTQNIGTSRHMNKIAEMVKTSWFFALAGDDILLKDCAEIYVDYVSKYDARGLVFSKLLLFSGESGNRKYWIDREEELYQEYFSKLTAIEQNKALKYRDVLCSPTLFFKKDAYFECGGCDEAFKNIEDWPFKMRLTSSNLKMDYIDEYTTLYRQGNSTSRSNDCYFKADFLEEVKKIEKKYCDSNDIGLIKRWNNMISWHRYHIIIGVFRNKRNTVTKIANYLLVLLNTEKTKKMIINTFFSYRSKKIVNAICNKYELY